MKSKFFLYLVIACCLSGCGQKGPLYKESKTDNNQTEQTAK